MNVRLIPNTVSPQELAAQQRPDMTLTQPFYTCPSVFERDLERIISKQWLFVDHVSALPTAGCFITYEIAGESILVVRGRDGEVRAFFNVCRHRGSRICSEASGKLNALVCPYHAWTYDLDGRLKRARHMPDDFDPVAYGLHQCQARIWSGMVFITLADADEPELLAFDALAEDLEPFVSPNEIAQAKVVARRSYPTTANWKLVVENFRECYHCAPAHPEYTDVNSYVRLTERDIKQFDPDYFAWASKWNASSEHGPRVTGRLNPDSSDDRQPHGGNARPIREGWQTLSQTGQSVAPLMGQLRSFDGGNAIVIFGPLSYLYVANDHVTTFRFTPCSAGFTQVDLSWVVREDAAEEAVDLDRLTWLWDTTTLQDTRIINNNQLGVNSSRYQPGPYAPRERGSAGFIAWYLTRLGRQ